MGANEPDGTRGCLEVSNQTSRSNQIQYPAQRSGTRFTVCVTSSIAFMNHVAGADGTMAD